MRSQTHLISRSFMMLFSNEDIISSVSGFTTLGSQDNLTYIFLLHCSDSCLANVHLRRTSRFSNLNVLPRTNSFGLSS